MFCSETFFIEIIPVFTEEEDDYRDDSKVRALL